MTKVAYVAVITCGLKVRTVLFFHPRSLLKFYQKNSAGDIVLRDSTLCVPSTRDRILMAQHGCLMDEDAHIDRSWSHTELDAYLTSVLPSPMNHGKTLHAQKGKAPEKPYWALLTVEDGKLAVYPTQKPNGRDAYDARSHNKANRLNSKLLIGTLRSSDISPATLTHGLLGLFNAVDSDTYGSWRTEGSLGDEFSSDVEPRASQHSEDDEENWEDVEGEDGEDHESGAEPEDVDMQDLTEEMLDETGVYYDEELFVCFSHHFSAQQLQDLPLPRQNVLLARRPWASGRELIPMSHSQIHVQQRRQGYPLQLWCKKVPPDLRLGRQ